MPKKSSPVKPSGSRKGRRDPSPVIILSETDEGLDNESEAQSGQATPVLEVAATAASSRDGESSDVDVDQLLEFSKYVGNKKRAASKIDSDSDIEVLSHATVKKTKIGHSSSLLAALDEPLSNDKRLPTEKAKAAGDNMKSPSKRATGTAKPRSQQAISVGDSAAVPKTLKMPQVKPASDTEAVHESERGLLAKCVLVPFSSNAKASEDETMMDLKNFLSMLLTKRDVRLVASALKFTSHAPFINPSLASPDLVAVEKDHLVWADSRLNAVFFTTGCVSACNLITPAPGINNGAAVKKLLLFPIEGIFQDGLDYFGCKFKVTQAAGQISNGMVTYATKKEGHTVYSSSSSIMGSPKKKGLFKKSASQSATTPGGGYPVSLSFGDNVPVYDATDGKFEFKSSDLGKIRSLPLFRNGAHDLPPYAVVTVGYTVTSFVTTNSASANTALLFNVLFVVLLAERVSDEEDQ